MTRAKGAAPEGEAEGKHMLMRIERAKPAVSVADGMTKGTSTLHNVRA